MWYYEKELWSKLGLSKEIEKLDYEQAAEKVSQEYKDARRGDERELVSAGRRVSPKTTGRAQSSVQPGEDAGSSQQLDGGESAGRRDGGRRASPGRRPEPTGYGGRRFSSGCYSPLEGAPSSQGATGPNPEIVDAAEQYARENGINLKRQAEYVKVDEDRARRIAQAFENMTHSPDDPAVKEAYDDLIRQTKAQYDALVKAGYVFSFYDGTSDPYDGNPVAAMRDLRQNKAMSVYGTYDGYGTEGITKGAVDDNPMLADTELKWKDQNGVERPVTANELFRAVQGWLALDDYDRAEVMRLARELAQDATSQASRC